MKVLLATDFSTGASVASRWLANTAWSANTQIEAVHVLASRREGAQGGLSGARVKAASAEVAAVASNLSSRLGPDVSVGSSTLVGDPATAIVERAAEIEAELVVLGSRGRGHFAGHLLGSVSAAVAANARCSALVARREAIRSLLLAEDGSASAVTAAETLLACSFLASVPTAVTSVVGAGPLGDGTGQSAAACVERRVADLHRAGRAAIGRVAQGDVAVELLRAARMAGTDLIVIGVASEPAPEHRGLGRSVAGTVLAGFRGSVLIARASRSGDRARGGRGLDYDAGSLIPSADPSRHSQPTGRVT